MKFKEDTNTELKREYTEDIKKTVIAFANTGGGIIYIGIADDGTVTGLDNLDDTMLKISNSIRDSIKPDITLFTNYETVRVKGEEMLKVTVQKGTASPYYLAAKGIRPEGVYVRHGASTVPATETAILRMIKDTDGEKYEAARALQQELTFIEAQKEFAARDVPFGTNQQKTLGIMTPGEVYTNLGLLLSDQCVHTIKLAVFQGSSKEIFKDRREYSGSLLKQMNEVYAFIDFCNRTRAEFEGLHRMDRRDYPTEAVREALLNALVHRDYSYSSSTLISIFDDRMEFVSIGGLAKGITLDDIMLGISVARNERLANVFYRLELIEAYGAGMPKIMRGYQGTLRKPKIEATDNAFKITLPNINETMDDGIEGDRFFGNEKIILGLFDGQSSIMRKDVEKALSVSQAMAIRALKGLVDKGAIRPVGGGRNTRYILPQK